jgi:hypothetical protein
MKSIRLVAISVAALLAAGCATSLAPSENFNNWTNSASYHHYSEPRSGVATQTPASLAKAPGREDVHP